jgi:site-specific recombinase XerD
MLQQKLIEAVNIGIDIHRKLGYSTSSRCYFTRISFEFINYLGVNNLEYSADLAKNWAKDNKKPSISGYIYNSTFKILDEILVTGTSAHLIDAKDRSCFKYIAKDFQNIITAYLGIISSKECQIDTVKVYCSQFLRYLESINIKNLYNISFNSINSYINSNIYLITGSIRHEIFYFLQYLSTNGFIANADLQRYKNLLLPTEVPISLSKSDQLHFSELAESDEKTYTLSEYDVAFKKYMSYLLDSNYSKTTFVQSERALNELKRFLIFFEFPYSNSIATFWIMLSSKFWKKSNCLQFKRTVQSFNSLINNEPILSAYYEQKYIRMPEIFSIELNNYINSRKNNKISQSRLCSINSSCNRLFKFFNSKGIKDWSEITPQDLKEFHKSDPHSTPGGRNATSYIIRGFFTYLADKGIVNPTLANAIPSVSAPRVRIIETLSEDQIAIIFERRKKASSPMELRDAAIVMLGLTVGLRASDIINLRLSDISWKNSTISIFQQKTKQPLKLPLTVVAGNSLWLYINKGRPVQKKSDFIFLSTDFPFCTFSSGVCTSALKRMLGENKATVGFHITRKTYASKLLSSGTNVEDISNLLGHKGTSTLDPYLSTDNERMRLCALDLDDITYYGDLDL